MGSNYRCVGTRAHALGWRPTHGTPDLITSIKDEVRAVVAAPEIGAKMAKMIDEIKENSISVI